MGRQELNRTNKPPPLLDPHRPSPRPSWPRLHRQSPTPETTTVSPHLRREEESPHPRGTLTNRREAVLDREAGDPQAPPTCTMTPMGGVSLSAC